MRAIWLALLVVGYVVGARAQGRYTQIDYPGAIVTACLDVNNSGDAVGYYQDSSGIKGFLLKNGEFTSISYPNSSLTELDGINEVGQIVGVNWGNGQGFVYDIATGTFPLTVVYPGAESTVPQDINDAGTIVGGYQLPGSSPQAFSLAGSTYTQLRAPASGAANLTATGVTSSGLIVVEVPNYGNFTLVGDKYRRIPVPVHRDPLVFGISPSGNLVAGFYETSQDYNQGAFLYRRRDGSLARLNFPGADHTLAEGVNDTGEVVGVFTFAGSINDHCFLWTPPKETH